MSRARAGTVGKGVKGGSDAILNEPVETATQRV
jgi:hypothetical protein